MENEAPTTKVKKLLEKNLLDLMAATVLESSLVDSPSAVAGHISASFFSSCWFAGYFVDDKLFLRA